MRAAATLLVPLLLAGNTAQALEIHSKLSLLLAGRQDPRAGDVVSVIPLYGLAALQLDDLGLPVTDESRLVLQGWGRYQVGDDELKDNSTDLALFYLDARKGPVRLRLGRQHLASGVSRMELIDGADARVDIAAGISAQGFFGYTVHPELRHRSDNWLGGGRLGFNLLPLTVNGEVGVSYLQRRQGGELRRHDMGVDAYSQFGGVRVLGNAVVTPALGKIDLLEARLAGNYHVSEHILLAVNVERVAPALFLPLNSIFSVFSDVQHDAAGAEVTWDPSHYWEVDVGLHGMMLNGEYLGYKALLRGITYREASHRSLIGAEVKRLDEEKNGYVRGRLFTGLQILEPLRLSADLFGYVFDEELNAINYSVIGQLSAVYDITDSIRVAGTVAGGVTPWAESQVEGMLRFAWGYDLDLSRDVTQEVAQ